MDSQQLDQTTKLLRATFLTNLAVLRVHMPNVYEFFRDYTPTNVRLAFDAAGEINLVRDGLQVYPDSPRAACYEQVDVFINDPKSFRYFPQNQDEKGFEHYLHTIALREIREKAEIRSSHQHYLSPFDVDRSPDCFCVLGSGLGYHLEKLSLELNIAFLYLFEPDPDCLYATLHTIDFAPIIERCRSRGGFLKITVGGGDSTFVNEISSMIDQQGAFNLSRLLVYRHYFGEDIDKAFQLIHDLAYRYVSGWGFFEDEAISIAHSLHNMQMRIPVLKRVKKEQSKISTPVFIVGNGPSLDKTIDFIFAEKDKAIIFSCGTALRPLVARGIIPDLHIESERTFHVYEWLQNAGNQEVFDSSVLIGPNILPPKAVALFKHKYLFIKPHDAGGLIIQNACNDHYENLFLCAPTVSNGAAAAAVAMGFNNLYLFGVDYGFWTEEYHHSKSSAYYQKDWKGETAVMESHFEIDASRGGKILTNTVFDMSRGIMEMLLEQHPVKCYNLSDGALIRGAIFMDPDLPITIDYSDSEEKADVIKKTLANRFDMPRSDGEAMRRQFFDDFHRLEQLTLLLMNMSRGVNRPNTREELHRVFMLQYNTLNKIKNDKNLRVAHRLLKGTFCYHQTTIMSYVYTIKDPEERKEYIHEALDLFNQHLIDLCEKLAERYDQHDDTVIYQ